MNAQTGTNATSTKKTIWQYTKVNITAKKAGALAAIIIILGFVYFYYFQSAPPSSSQKSDLNSAVNSKSANVKSLLLDPQLYAEDSNLSEITSIGRTSVINNSLYSLIFNPANATISLASEMNPAHEPLVFSRSTDSHVRGIILKALYDWGAPVNSSGASVPPSISSFELTYLSIYDEKYILQVQAQLGFLFGCQLFNDTGTHSNSLYGLAAPKDFKRWASTSRINYPANENLTVLPADWISLMVAGRSNQFSKIINNGSVTCQNGESLSENELFYMLSFGQYESYLFSQLLYNTTIQPSIRLIAYTDNKLVANLGNVNLSDNITALYVDGRQANFVRFFNFLISNESLSVGTHYINVTVGGNRLNGTLVVAVYNSTAPNG